MNAEHVVTVFGCGGWGERVIRKLHARGDTRVVIVDPNLRRVQALGDELGVSWSADPYGYLMVTGTSRSTVEGGSVIVATPPDTRVELVTAILNGYGKAPVRLRVEKPLAISNSDAAAIVDACNATGTTLSVGFTLLHSPAYAAAFRYIWENELEIERVIAVRIGASARHKTSAIVDLGSHAASLAAYVDAPLTLTAAYSSIASSRRTEFVATNGDAVYVDELAGTVQARNAGNLEVATFDALTADLDAFLTDTHRGTATVGIHAVDTINRELEAVSVA